MQHMNGNKYYPISSDSLPISSFPFFSLKGFYITIKGVGPHFMQMVKDKLLTVWGEFIQLSFGFFGEPDGPGWFRAVRG